MITAFLAWITGIFLQLQQAQLWPAWCYGLALGAGVVGLCGRIYGKRKCAPFSSHKFSGFFSHLIVGLCLALAGFAWAGLYATHKKDQELDARYEQQDILVTGRVDGLPQMQSGRWRFMFKVDHASFESKEVELPPHLLLSWYFHGDDPGSVPDLKTGQEWSFLVRLKAPRGAVNFHTFDYELWLWSQGVGAVGYVRTAKNVPEPSLLDEGYSYANMVQWREAVREKINQTVTDSRQAGLITALTLGDQRAVSSDDWDTFRITGIVHLVSISGLHIIAN
ncbi:MAG: ComEC/Rec2 family competence protein [Saezia sp.]